MIRWGAALLLVLVAAGTGWLALETKTKRGVTLRLYDNLRWSGDPAEEREVRHLDYGPSNHRQPLQLPDRSSLRMEGWLYAPRGGVYDFAIESTDDTWIRIDDKTVLTHRRGREITEIRTPLEKGFHVFRLQVRHRRGESNLRVFWRLPSGYMNLEPLQPIFLQPTVPRAGPSMPLALRVGPVLLLILAFLVLVGPALAQRLRRLRSDRGYRLKIGAAFFLFCVALGVRLWDLNGAGETSDEWAYCGAGRIYVSNAAHGYFDSLYWNTNEEHPPVGKYIYGLASHLSGTDSYTPLRATSALLGSLTIVLTFLFGARFLSLWTGFFAGLTLTLMPSFIAHGKVAALDSPSAFIFTLGAYLFVHALHATRRQNAWYLLAGFVACLAFATKFSNATLFVFMVSLHLASQYKNLKTRGLVELPLPLYILPFMPLLVLLVMWPWLWREPFGQFVTTLHHWDYPIREWFLGHYRQLPWYYFPAAFLATTPALLLVPFGLFFYDAIRKRTFTHLTVLLWFLAPFLWSISVLKQDGIRYVYTMYPPMALMLGIGANSVLKSLKARSIATGAAALYLAWQCVSVHPYYLDYYSETVGGTQTVWKKSLFDVGWWGEGMDRAFDYVNEKAPPGATWDLNAVVTHTSDVLRSDLVNDPTKPDYFIKANLTPGEVAREGYVEEFRVEVDAAPIVIVYRRVDLPRLP